jgi:hypothetical protein
VDDGGGVVGLDGAAEGLAAGQERGLVGLGGGVVEGEALVVVAEVLGAAEPDFLVGVVPGSGPGGHVAERAAPPAWVELRSAVLVSQLLR